MKNAEIEKLKTELEMHKMVLRLLNDNGYLSLYVSSPIKSNINTYYFNNEIINEATYKLISKVKNNLYK